MKLFGLTGGIGMGKSTSASLLARRGFSVVDTDVLAREVVEPGQPALAEIRAVFGEAVFDSNGTLKRGVLADIVFASPEKRKQLEAILHPRIRERWNAQVEEWRQSGVQAGVVVIPLLFETAAEKHFDFIVCTACSAATQRQRLHARSWPENQIEQRLAAQWPVERKMAAANYVVWTEPDLTIHERQIEKVFGAYLSPRR